MTLCGYSLQELPQSVFICKIKENHYNVYPNVR